MVKKIVGGFFLLLLFLVLFSPKEELYYLLEKNLEKNGIIISNEKFTDTLFGLSITDADLYIQGINMAKIKELKLNIFFLHNQLSIEQVATDKGIHKMAPKEIENLTATWSLLSPHKIAITGNGSFGSIDGGYYFAQKKIIIRPKEAKNINKFRKFLKKDTKGFYYEKLFK